MQQLIDLWGALDARRRGVLVGGLAGLVTVMVLLTRLAGAPSFALLYSGLDPSAAGEVISALEARGIAYEVRGDSIHVEETERDALRMSLAGEGLPALGAAGYELLDSLSGFGTTSQMFDAAYWRAKEGELARTIAASPRIRAARVHLAAPTSDPFAPTRDPSASVSIQPVSGGISSGHAQALRYLVASAVPGLLPENVTIIDSDTGRVLANDDAQSLAGDTNRLSDSLRRNVERLLNARVGPGNAVVEVSVELETAHQTVFERIIDPDSRVVIGTDSEESSNTSRDAGNAAVTVASNLPEGDAAAGGGSSEQTSETRERVTYDISETQRETESGPGTVRRITVAVLVNAVPIVGPDGVMQQQPRDADELQSLRDLVQSAVGYDEARGDVVTLQSMVFEPQEVVIDAADSGSSLFSRFDLMQLLQLVALVGVALAVAFGVVRPALRPGAAVRELQPQADLPRVGVEEAATQASPGILPPADLSARTPAQIAREPAQDVSGTGSNDATASQLSTEVLISEDSLDPVARLRRLIEEREEETVQILRSWMEEDEELT